MLDYPFRSGIAGRHCNRLPERGKGPEMADFVGSAARAEDLGGAVKCNVQPRLSAFKWRKLRMKLWEKTLCSECA
jgi:hypothetical protein